MKTLLILSAVTILLFASCGRKMDNGLKHNNSRDSDTISSLPDPKFDKELQALLADYKEKFHAEDVRIRRPFWRSSDGDSSYWIRVEFLNPGMGNNSFKEFGREVAINTMDHLLNDEDFEKIEVGVTKKSGFIITLSSSQNAFYYRDSLQVSE